MAPLMLSTSDMALSPLLPGSVSSSSAAGFRGILPMEHVLVEGAPLPRRRPSNTDTIVAPFVFMFALWMDRSNCCA